MLLVCHVILKDHAIKGLCNFMVRSHCTSEDVMFLVAEKEDF